MILSLLSTKQSLWIISCGSMVFVFLSAQKVLLILLTALLKIKMHNLVDSQQNILLMKVSITVYQTLIALKLLKLKLMLGTVSLINTKTLLVVTLCLMYIVRDGLSLWALVSPLFTLSSTSNLWMCVRSVCPGSPLSLSNLLLLVLVPVFSIGVKTLSLPLPMIQALLGATLLHGLFGSLLAFTVPA